MSDAETRAELENSFPDNVYNTEEVRRNFEVIGFCAPFVSVGRKVDNVKGTLEFFHNPRFYFNFVAE